MAWYKRNGRYYYVPANAQIVKQEAEAEAEVEVENGNENENESEQGDAQFARATAKVTNVNVVGNAATGQASTINQTGGADVNTANSAQTSNQTTGDNVAVAAAVPVNTGDQTINDYGVAINAAQVPQ